MCRNELFGLMLLVSCWAVYGQKQVLFVPHFSFKDQAWKTEIALTHTGSQTKEVFAIAYDSSGVLQGSQKLEVDPDEGLAGDLRGLFPNLVAGSGWMELVTTGEPVQGLVTFTSVRGGGVTRVPLVQHADFELVLPLVEHDASFRSGFSIVNTAARAAVVTASLFDFDGNLVDQVDHQLDARAQWIAMLDQVFAGALPAVGYLRMQSSVPMVALGLSFSPNQDQIVAIPAVRSAQDETLALREERDIAELATSVNAFAVMLYHHLRETSANVLFSPVSITSSLSMVLAGARGRTDAEISNALRHTLPPDDIHASFFGLNRIFGQRAKGLDGTSGDGFRLESTQSLWSQSGYSISADFVDLLEVFYEAECRSLDFAHQPEASRQTINDWVADQTEQRIEELLLPGAISEFTRFVLVNTVYFRAAWADPFCPDETADAAFHLLDGDEVTVPLMVKSRAMLSYVKGEDYQAVALPYESNELAMVFLLPDDEEFLGFESNLTASKLAGATRNLAPETVTLFLPRFGFTTDAIDLVEPLTAMGMPTAFSGDADFSGIDPEGGLFLSDVVHKAFISVDEAGTEAGASTAVAAAGSSQDEVPVIRLDRPFLFLIEDLETGTILFMGRVLDPTLR